MICLICNRIWIYEPDYRNAVIYSTQTGLRIEKVTKTEDGEEQVNIKRGQTLVQLKATMQKPQPDQRWNAKNECWEWSLSQLKAFKLAELTSIRWEVQCAGVQVSAIVFASSPDDATRLKTPIDDAQLMDDEEITFKAKNAFVDIRCG